MACLQIGKYYSIIRTLEEGEYMMVTLQANVRNDRRKSATRQLRKAGHVPAVVYGKNIDNQPIYVDGIQFVKIVRDEGKNALIRMNVGTGTTTVMIGEVQTDSLKKDVLHIDFYEVNMSKEMILSVPLEFVGESAGEKNGGILQRQYQEVEIKCLPANAPEKIEVNISELDIGQSLTAAEIATDTSYELQIEPDTVLVSVLAPASEEELEEATEEPEVNEEAEPELVGDGDDRE